MTNTPRKYSRRNVIKSSVAGISLASLASTATTGAATGDNSGNVLFDKAWGSTSGTTDLIDESLISWESTLSGYTDEFFPLSDPEFTAGLVSGYDGASYGGTTWGGQQYGAPGNVKIKIDPTKKPEGARTPHIEDVFLFTDGGGDVDPNLSSDDLVEWGLGYAVSLLNTYSPIPIPDISGLSGESKNIKEYNPDGSVDISLNGWRNALAVRWIVNHGSNGEEGAVKGTYGFDVSVEYEYVIKNEYANTVGSWTETKTMSMEYDIT